LTGFYKKFQGVQEGVIEVEDGLRGLALWLEDSTLLGVNHVLQNAYNISGDCAPIRSKNRNSQSMLLMLTSEISMMIRGTEIAAVPDQKQLCLAKKFNAPQLRYNYHLLLACPTLSNRTCSASERP